MAAVICAHDPDTSLVLRHWDIWGRSKICKAGIVTQGDVRQLAILAHKAFDNYMNRCYHAVRRGDTLPSPPAVKGVLFMSLDRYKTLRGMKYELEDLVY